VKVRGKKEEIAGGEIEWDRACETGRMRLIVAHCPHGQIPEEIIFTETLVCVVNVLTGRSRYED